MFKIIEILDTIYHKLPGEGRYWYFSWICDKYDDYWRKM